MSQTGSYLISFQIPNFYSLIKATCTNIIPTRGIRNAIHIMSMAIELYKLRKITQIPYYTSFIFRCSAYIFLVRRKREMLDRSLRFKKLPHALLELLLNFLGDLKFLFLYHSRQNIYTFHFWKTSHSLLRLQYSKSSNDNNLNSFLLCQVGFPDINNSIETS